MGEVSILAAESKLGEVEVGTEWSFKLGYVLARNNVVWDGAVDSTDFGELERGKFQGSKNELGLYWIWKSLKIFWRYSCRKTCSKLSSTKSV